MRSQRDELIKKLLEFGWQLVEIDEQPSGAPHYYWWADEILTIESVWSPIGFRAYVFFEIDPQCDYRNRKKGENVWSVGVAPYRQSNEHSTTVCYEFPVAKGHWKESLKELFAALNKFRQTAVNETSLV